MTRDIQNKTTKQSDTDKARGMEKKEKNNKGETKKQRKRKGERNRSNIQ